MNSYKKQIIILITIINFFCLPSFSQNPVSNYDESNILLNKEKLYERDYINAYCNGIKEYELKDRTRVDCLTISYACEFDWANKWYEGIGQSLWYSYKTGKKPCLVLILNKNKDYIYFNRAKILCDKYNIKLIEIKAKDYKTD